MKPAACIVAVRRAQAPLAGAEIEHARAALAAAGLHVPAVAVVPDHADAIARGLRRAFGDGAVLTVVLAGDARQATAGAALAWDCLLARPAADDSAALPVGAESLTDEPAPVAWLADDRRATLMLRVAPASIWRAPAVEGRLARWVATVA